MGTKVIIFVSLIIGVVLCNLISWCINHQVKVVIVQQLDGHSRFTLEWLSYVYYNEYYTDCKLNRKHLFTI